MHHSTKSIPVQDRAVERVQSILSAARRLFTEMDVADANMAQIAAAAGSKPAAVYRYFPNKNAIIAELFKQHCGINNSLILATLRSMDSLQSFPAVGTKVIRSYAALMQDDPSTRAISFAVRSNVSLRYLEYQNHELLARMIVDVLMGFAPGATCHDKVQQQIRVILTSLGPALREGIEADTGQANEMIATVCELVEVQPRHIVATIEASQ
jgi:AcrR family transcriptional regulator